MPRKTRKQKLNAQKRKIATPAPLLGTDVDVSPKNSQGAVISEQMSQPKSFKAHEKSPVRNTVLSETDKTLRRYTIQDIVRTITLISFLFAAQAALYFAQSHGYLSRLLP